MQAKLKLAEENADMPPDSKGSPKVRSPEGLNARQRLSIDCLVNRGMTIRRTADELNISENTIYRWRRNPLYLKAYQHAMASQFDNSGGHGVSLLPEVIQQLSTILRSSESSNSDKIQASKVLITSAHEYQIRKGLEAKISELERRLIKLAQLKFGGSNSKREIAAANEIFGELPPTDVMPDVDHLITGVNDPDPSDADFQQKLDAMVSESLDASAEALGVTSATNPVDIQTRPVVQPPGSTSPVPPPSSSPEDEDDPEAETPAWISAL